MKQRGIVNQATPKFLLAKYDSVQFIDKGIDGCVYKCVRNDTVTAVKVLVDPLDPVARARFDREVQILKRFDHPHIVKLLDAGETDGYHWLESEFADESHFGKMFPANPVAGKIEPNRLCERIEFAYCRSVDSHVTQNPMELTRLLAQGPHADGLIDYQKLIVTITKSDYSRGLKVFVRSNG